MKKILLGVLALSLVFTVTAFTIGGKKKITTKKAKVECTKGCPDSKDCHKSATCPNRPGCYCNK